MPALTPAIPTIHPLPLGIPMDMDATRQLPLHFANLDFPNPPPLLFPHREALYEDDQSSGRAMEEEHREEFGGIHKPELLDKAVEVGD
ncbi:hypothetical protein E4T56_gene12211 [Termitomyces sp. T112]|nr:hypothetical protein E4T56_gene12211 [Termitomyces sp. T112]